MKIITALSKKGEGIIEVWVEEKIEYNDFIGRMD